MHSGAENVVGDCFSDAGEHTVELAESVAPALGDESQVLPNSSA